MNHLMRELAPITDAGWEALDREARTSVERFLAARRLVDFEGPHGWEYSATSAGRIQKKAATQPVPGAHLRVRQVVSAVELRVPFLVSRAELAAVDRGAADTDFDGLDEAARKLAHAENNTVFEGSKNAGIDGIADSPHPAIALDSGFDSYPRAVAWAVERLREAGVNGPYGIALSPAEYTGVVETTEHGGYPVFDHVRRLLGGPVVWGPGMEEHGLVVSLRGGDFVFASGEDISIGYSHHDEQNVHLYFEESFTFKVNEPRAAIVLKR